MHISTFGNLGWTKHVQSNVINQSGKFKEKSGKWKGSKLFGEQLCAWSVRNGLLIWPVYQAKVWRFWLLFMWTINEGAKKWQVGGDGFLGNNKISSEWNVRCKVNIGPLFLYLFLKLKLFAFLATTFAQIKTAWKSLIGKIIPTYFVRKGTGQMPYFGSFPFAFVLQLRMEKMRRKLFHLFMIFMSFLFFAIFRSFHLLFAFLIQDLFLNR